MPEARPEELLDRPVPDLILPSTSGEPFRFHAHRGTGALVLFFYLRNASPG